ncbi:MAG TPA: hypothetical protein PKL13_01395 [bacterium]|nr:hypothetical protein [bacterium]
MKNNKKNDQIIYNKLVKKAEFINNFSNIIKNERSPLGKLLLQENYIFFNIINLLHNIKLTINYSIKNEFDNNKKLNSVGYALIKLPGEKILFNNYTLGKIIQLLKQFINSDSNIIKKLDKYNKNRNELTHKMFEKYNDIKIIRKDARKIIIDGEKILKNISRLSDEFRENAFALMEKYHIDESE